MRPRSAHFSGCLLILLPLAVASSQDRVFTYTYQTQVLAPHQFEIEVWNTLRWGRLDYYRALDQRIEFEAGIAKDLQTAFYLNVRSTASSVPPSGSPPTGASLQSVTEMSFSNEWKYKLLDPVADPIGLALYGEYTVSTMAFELEPRLIIDKTIGRTTLALNASAEFESEKVIEADGTEETEHSSELNFNFAIGVRLSEDLHLGIEVFNTNAISNGVLDYSALFAGPTLSYSVDRFWVNVTFMPQLTALKGETANGLVLKGSERYQTRLLFSYAP
jgi:hypothetical protein